VDGATRITRKDKPDRALSAARWRRVEALYHEALSRPNAEHEAFLREACAGDEALLAEVMSLLRHTSSSDSLPHVTTPATLGVSLAGGRVGVYQVENPIGAGGMGVVYRARDTRLGRDVAIKVLPRAFSTDADRIARFEREARMLASLNHPHIATIHGIEDANGSPAIVMELVDGETLADRLSRLRAKGRTLPLEDTLAIAKTGRRRARCRA